MFIFMDEDLLVLFFILQRKCVMVVFIVVRVTQHYAHVSYRLHTCHNSYILAIHNANSHQHYYKTVLLPFTFDTFQDRMELHVGEW